MQLKEIRMSSITIKQIDVFGKVYKEIKSKEESPKKCIKCDDKNPLVHIQHFSELKDHRMSDEDYFTALRLKAKQL